MTGAEKALLIAFSLAIVVLLGALVSRGSDKAANDAKRTLGKGQGSTAALGQVVAPGPLALAGAVQQPGQVAPPSQAPAAPAPSPAPAPTLETSNAPLPRPPPAAPAAPPKPYAGPDPPATLGNFRELAAFVQERYNTGEPIGIIKISGMDKAYLVVLSGTEFLADGAAGPKQATYIPEDLRSAFRANDDYRDNILRAMKAYGIPKGAQVFVAGHSLGGMEAQNIVADPRFRRQYNPLAVATYGAPLTTPNLKGVPTNRFSTPGDPVVKLSPISAPDTVARTAAWGGHYILKIGSFGYVDRRPVAPIWERYQTLVGPQIDSLLERHNAYRSLPELEKYPLGGPDGKPLQLDTNSFRTFKNPRISIETGPLLGRIPVR